MVCSKAPSAYYSTMHDSITSLCKTLLPLSFKKRCLVSAEPRLWNLQSENLKWQQDSFRQMLKLMGLHKDDILPEAEVSAFKTHLLDTLLASTPPQQDHALILRDKLSFLQELLQAKCISEGEYNSSRRPLLQRLAAQGGKIEDKDILVAGSKDYKQNSEEEWSVIDLKDEQYLTNKENSNSNKKKSKQTRKQVKKSTSGSIFGSSYKHSIEKSIFDSPSLQMHSAHSRIPPQSIYSPEKMKRKTFRTLFQREKKEGDSCVDDNVLEVEGRTEKSGKKQWGFDGLKKWKRRDLDDETVPLSLSERSDSKDYLASYDIATKTCGEEPVLMKNNLNSDGSPYDFSKNDQAFGDKVVNKELSRIKTELRSTNTNLNFSNNQIQAVSTELPEDKAHLNNIPKCGEVVLDMVRIEFEDLVGQKERMQKEGEKSLGWTTFEDDENTHPNLFVHQHSLRSGSINPFSLDY